MIAHLCLSPSTSRLLLILGFGGRRCCHRIGRRSVAIDVLAGRDGGTTVIPSVDRVQSNGDVVVVSAVEHPPVGPLPEQETQNDALDELDKEDETKVPGSHNRRPGVPSRPVGGLAECQHERGVENDGVGSVPEEPLVDQGDGSHGNVGPQGGPARSAVGPHQRGPRKEPDGPDLVVALDQSQVGLVKVHHEGSMVVRQHVPAVGTGLGEADAVAAVADRVGLLHESVRRGRDVDLVPDGPTRTLDRPPPVRCRPRGGPQQGGR